MANEMEQDYRFVVASFGVVVCYNCPCGWIPTESSFELKGLPLVEFLFHVIEFVADLLLVVGQTRIPTTLVHIPPTFLTWSLFIPVL
jgi:hypothetical protein